MQPYLFPYIGYFQLIKAVDKFIVFDDVNYINKGWINRNNILVNGKPSMFTLTLQGASQNKLISEISISDRDKWVKKFLKTLGQSYKKAPYYEEGMTVIGKALMYGEDNLSLFLTNSIETICAYLDIKTIIEPTSGKYDAGELKGQERIIQICNSEKADEYINPIGGVELYSKDAFEKHKIKLTFIKSNTITYNQFGSEFVPFLSVIDVIMFNGRQGTINLLTNCTFQDGV